jgi:DNA-binding NtrC family response regulator
VQQEAREKFSFYEFHKTSMKLLAIDDQKENLELIRAALVYPDLEVHTASDPQIGMDLVRRLRPQIVMLDLIMPGVLGMELLRQIVDTDPGIDVILMTGQYSTESAVEAIQAGATDYLPKPFSLETLRRRIGQLLEDARRRKHASKLEDDLSENLEFEGMIGRSPRMLDLFAKIRRIGPHFRAVLVTGPTGVGKDLVARALHRRSPSPTGPFVAANCSAISETLAESELFGYVKGAFTGALQDKTGLFEYANGGTALLDEIGDMPLTMQAKLLRVLQNQELQRLGSPVTRKLDVRIVAATNRDLSEMVKCGKFREDLYFRLTMVTLKVPSLAERPEDLLLLQRHFLKRFAAEYKKPVLGLTRRAQTLLGSYSWPGNVRELENVIGHACMMTESEAIDIRDLPESVQNQNVKSFARNDELLSLAQAERLHVEHILNRVGGNKAVAAKTLGISRTSLYRILNEPTSESVPDSIEEHAAEVLEPDLPAARGIQDR